VDDRDPRARRLDDPEHERDGVRRHRVEVQRQGRPGVLRARGESDHQHRNLGLSEHAVGSGPEQQLA
jgi:hypothetical protein